MAGGLAFLTSHFTADRTEVMVPPSIGLLLADGSPEIYFAMREGAFVTSVALTALPVLANFGLTLPTDNVCSCNTLTEGLPTVAATAAAAAAAAVAATAA